MRSIFCFYFPGCYQYINNDDDDDDDGKDDSYILHLRLIIGYDDDDVQGKIISLFPLI